MKFISMCFLLKEMFVSSKIRDFPLYKHDFCVIYLS